MSDTAIVQKKEPQFFYLHSKKLYYAPSYKTVESGGVVRVKCASAENIPTVSVDQFRAMLSSGSDKVWSPHVTPSNLIFIEVVEGVVPFCVFNVEGHDIGRKLMLLPQLEVLGRILPKLYEQALADPKGSGCGSFDAADFPGKTEEQIAKKIAENKARLEALKWTPEDCKADRGSGTVKPARPSMANNKWPSLPQGENSAWMARFSPLIDNLRPSKNTKGGKKGAEDDANKTFPGLEIADTTKMVGNKIAELAVTFSPGENVSYERQGNVCYLRLYATDKKRSRAEFEEEDAVAEDDEIL
jgi:hypothetical protein